MDKVLEFFQGDELATKVWKNKYKFGGEQTPKDMFERHIKEIAEKEFERIASHNLTGEQYDNLSNYGKKRCFNYLENDRIHLNESIIENLRNQLNFNAIVLGGSPMQGIGNHKMFSSLSNCFFVGRPYDSYSGINRKEDEIAQLMKRRGGAGIDLSSIRPNGAKVHNQASTSSGVVPFAEGYSAKTKQVAQYGRRGALMISLCMQHPDSKEFILSKQDDTKMTGANISVIIPDDFMEAVVSDSDYLLRFPVDTDLHKQGWPCGIDELQYNELIQLNKGVYVKKIKAKEYWQILIECAHKTAEPGILFSGNWMKGGTDWVYEQFRPIGTNPCFVGNMNLRTEDGDETFYDLARKCEVEFKERGKFALNLVNKENEIVPGRVWQTGIKRIITLQLDNGTIITCTPNHVFLSDGEECQAIDTEGKWLEGFEEDYQVIGIVDNGEEEVVYDFELKGTKKVTKESIKSDDICHWGIVQNVIAHNCMKADTPLLTDTGYYPIIDLVGLKVNVWNGTNFSEVEPKITGENQEMLKITLSDGSEFECTKYHKWPTWTGLKSRDGKVLMKETQQLIIGDKLHKFNLPIIEFGETIDTSLMYSQGFYSGDGTAARNSTRLYGEKIKLSTFLKGSISNDNERQNHYGTEYVCFIFDDKLQSKSFVPINKYSIKSRLDWFAGLIDADGVVAQDGSCQIVSVNKQFLKDTRLMLTTLGIPSKIKLARKAGKYNLPDQKGGLMLVDCNECNRILISSVNMQKLLKLGLITHRCDYTIFNPNRDANRFIIIEKIESIPNEEKVYCFNEPQKHMAVFNGILLGQCSEIPMSEYDACRLLARNLYTLVKNPFTLESELLSDDKIYSAFYEQMIIGDLLVDLEFDYIDRIIEKIKSGSDPDDLKQSEINIWNKIVDKAKQGRRCGAGFTGFGDMLAALGLPYYSPEVTEKVFKIKMKAELDASIDMAIQFGSFIGFDTQLEKNAIYNLEVIAKEFPEQYARMLEFGRRNVSWSTGAPVGTGSMMVQTTSGVEPLFLPFMERKLKCILPTDRVDYIDPADKQAYSLNYLMHPKFITWYIEYIRISIPNMDLDFIKIKTYLEQLSNDELNKIFEQSPWYKSCANDLNYHQRVEIQSIVQKYTTHAISSTINLPNDIDVSVIGNIYMESWLSGLKGNTVYREGSRSGIITAISDKKIDENNSILTEDDFEPIYAPKRPKILTAHYHTLRYKKKTYSVILGFYKNRLFEIFIISGVENIPEVFDEFEDFILGETVKDNENWYNFESETFTVREISDVEGEEKMLSLMLSGLLRGRTPIEKVIKILNKLQPIAGNFTHRLIKILSHYVGEVENINNDELCPECNEKLRHENGCVICVNGHSKC